MARGLRSNRHNLTTRQITAPATGPAPDTSGPTGTVPLASITSADDLKAIEALAGTSGLLAKTAANAWALRQLALSTAFETIAAITNPAGIAGNPTFELDNQAANEVLAGPASGSPGAPGFRALVAADLPFAVTPWTPTFTFATPGDLSVAYSAQSAEYVRLGESLIFVRLTCGFTPTYTTASGEGRITGMGLTPSANTVLGPVFLSSITFPVGSTYAAGQILTDTQFRVLSCGTAVAVAGWGATQFPSGSARTVQMAGLFIEA